MTLDEIGGMIGLYGGLICGLIGWWFGRKLAKKNRGLDEFYQHIWKTARSYSWYLTIFVLYLLFSLNIFGVEMSVPMVLAMLMFIHIGSWGVIGAIITINLSRPEPFQMSPMMIGITIIVVSTSILTIIAILIKNIWILFIAVLPNIVGLYIALLGRKKALE